MPDHAPAVPVRAFWSGTITFGLVSIPVDFYAGARGRDTAMKMVDAAGHALGRRYTSASTGKPLPDDEIVRGYESDDGKTVVLTEAEFDSAAPEISRDIDLERFVPLAQLPPSYFVRPYFLAPTQRAGKAYTLLAQTMERSGKVGIGRFVMRGHEYLVAIIAERGVLRAQTLRFFDELRTPEAIGLPAPSGATKPKVAEFDKEIGRLLEPRLDLHELEDRDADALEALARRKLKAHRDVVQLADADAEDEDEPEGGAQIVDLVQLLRSSLGGRVQAGPEPSEAAHPARKPAPAKAAREAHKAPSPRTSDDLEGQSREQLYARATQLAIPGRSKMHKEELLHAIRAAHKHKASG